MQRRAVFIKAALVLIFVWAGVWAVRSYAGSRKITSQKVDQEILAASFTDLSDRDAPDPALAERREKDLRKIASYVNRLDFNERQKNRDNTTTEEFFKRLSAREKSLFIDLTVMESMSKFMEAIDAMPPAQRRKFVEQGLKEIEEGRTEADMARADQLGGDVLDKISQQGMRAYFEKSSAETKLDLAPLMESMNELMQGIRGNQLRPPGS